MSKIISEKLTIECGPNYNLRVDEQIRYIIDDDGYKIYAPFCGCSFFLSTQTCHKCVDYIQNKMRTNTLDTSKPLHIPATL